MPELTCSFFGFKNNETADVLTKQPNVETTATKDSPAGTYPIIATGAEAHNYSFNYERGTLTITKADQEIEWNQEFEDIEVGSVVELTAISSAGLPIKYSVTENVTDSAVSVYVSNRTIHFNNVAGLDCRLYNLTVLKSTSTTPLVIIKNYRLQQQAHISLLLAQRVIK